MTTQTCNLLADSGLPLIFRMAGGGEAPLLPPTPRLGEAVRTVVRTLTVFQKEALVTAAGAGVTWRLASDEGRYLMGHDAAPPPLAFLTAGMVASYMTELTALARQRGVPLRDVRLTIDNFYTMRGSLQQGTMLAGADPVDLEAAIVADADQTTLRQLVGDAVAASPLNGLMRGVKESLFTLTHNGRAVTPERAPALAASAEPEPDDSVFAAAPAPDDWSGHLVRLGDSPAGVAAGAGSSLADRQDRRLHLRGICTLRPDGVKVIEQHLLSPHGTAWTFLSDEGPAAGGRGLAPDAASYISAGIGFCFMTQFGRYAKMQGSALTDYRIVQDAHFSLGGASGGTGRAGRAEPVETHVHLVSGEDDGFARHILDTAEQTCFLHAFCRTDLKARIRLAPARVAEPPSP